VPTSSSAAASCTFNPSIPTVLSLRSRDTVFARVGIASEGTAAWNLVLTVMARRKASALQPRPPPRLSRKELGPFEPRLPRFLRETYPAAVMTVQGALSDAEAAAVCAWAEAIGLDPTLASSGRPAKGEAYRDAHRALVADPAFAAALWNSGLGARVLEATPILGNGRRAVAFSDQIRLYRYGPGERFGRHYDGHGADSTFRQTEYTVLFYLSKCEGGETCFYLNHDDPEPAAVVAPAPGLCLLHRHGDECLQHEARAVSSGTKYVLRTDVVYSRDNEFA